MKRSTTLLQAIPDWFEEACSWRSGPKLKRRRGVIVGLGPTETRVRILLDGNMRPMTLHVCRLVVEQYSLSYGKMIRKQTSLLRESRQAAHRGRFGSDDLQHSPGRAL
ncbi:hypothetical protein M2222_009340 [Bradyrhizobium elkanii]|nr:hypothetical protein [Bradyrhizobium elkanii]MCS3566959.1 hypothetical protein [Bradyrhizobium elkanii]MCW2153859.1 hypothetical protein [Bradyrhizobium elkanii]MCW2380308.1 hypothetical protein [Bradyrhizobium elkanii]